MTKPTGVGRGGKRLGAGKKVGSGLGVRFSPAAREKIRGAVMLRIVDDIASGKIKDKPAVLAVRKDAAVALLKFQLPMLSAVDLTSGGEPFSIVVRKFGE